jgi:hypothetical protein
MGWIWNRRKALRKVTTLKINIFFILVSKKSRHTDGFGTNQLADA